MKRIGLIRTLTTSNRSLLHTHGHALQAAYGFSVQSVPIPGQPDGVHDVESLSRAVPRVRTAASQLAPHVDGIIISCAEDPGLAEAREAASIPVAGAGSAGAAAALAIGSRVGVLGIRHDAPAAVAAVLGDHLAAVESPPSVSVSPELLTPTGVFETLAAGERLAAAAADVILLACTGLSSMGVAGELSRRLGLPVVDGVLAAGAALAAMTSNRSQGPRHQVA
ncbi:aspartate/glutamate racemase family protein [Arthrobacter sp. I2-34]|uniref:Aspartate/glutamate racemase family protein n=1 Tax=Arthrobacter hankyongi TaxID=2904801 RepID=A0ABS9L5B4_9MICC|nr:aspartate/glutamate racemase family protein [Arthrobacter hankyongi]MCG2621659.1 aspartate/glutamate racemase family protein [Arthrobacter hankyongi]